MLIVVFVSISAKNEEFAKLLELWGPVETCPHT